MTELQDEIEKSIKVEYLQIISLLEKIGFVEDLNENNLFCDIGYFIKFNGKVYISTFVYEDHEVKIFISAFKNNNSDLIGYSGTDIPKAIKFIKSEYSMFLRQHKLEKLIKK